MPGQSLYESFEALLAELGLQIEIHAGGDGDQQITTNLSAIDGVGLHSSLLSDASESPRKDRRRASFHSLYETENGNVKSQATRPRSRASSAKLPFGKAMDDKLRPTRETIRAPGRTRDQTPRSQSSTAQPGRSRLTAQEYTKNLQHHQRRRSATNKPLAGTQNHVFPNSDIKNQADQAQMTNSRRQSSDANSSRLTNQEPTSGSQQNQPSYALAPGELLYRPSETQLVRDAETFEEYRIMAVTRKIIKKWRDAASHTEKGRRDMEIFAINHDARILLQQGFDHWRMRLREKRRIAETDRFFNRLEQRASRARDLFLLTKAFTHWAECASEEVLRTSRARHHILRLKYFNAWRDITVVNELKVRRRGLKKFFDVWKQRCVRKLTDDARAVSYLHDNLIKSTYWRWFWTFCEKRAPEWRATRLRMKYFRIWLVKHQKISRQENEVIESVHDDFKRGILFGWLEKSRRILSNTQEAVSFDRRRIVANSLREWKLTHQHAPLAQQVSNMVDWRVAGNTFATFVARFRAERRAEEVSRLRVLRNSWTQWNDRLRWQTLSQKIDDRFLLEALYKWVIAERARLLQRLVGQRLKQKILYAISDRFFATRARRFRSLKEFQRSRDLQLLRSTVLQWRLRLESHREEERAALSFYHPRIARESLQVWNNRRMHLKMLDSWADDSDYFFLGTKVLKRWQAAVVDSKRKKRRNAYVLIRRRLKMNLAREAIRQWHTVTTTLAGLDQQARTINQDRLLRMGSTLFDNWKSRTEFVVVQSVKADGYFQQRMITMQLGTWGEKFRSQQVLQERAQQSIDLRTEKDAVQWLHKLRLQMIELQGRARNAQSLLALHRKRHAHNFFRHWHSKTATRRGLPQRETVRSSRPKRFGLRSVAEEDFPARPDEWPEIEEGFDTAEWIPMLESESNSAQQPGYLSTPSKRAAKARPQDLLSGSTTPAGIPPPPPPLQRPTIASLPQTPGAIFQRATPGGVTPFQRRLRMQPQTDPRGITGRPSALSRSVAAGGGAFRAIGEDQQQPITPGPNRF